MLSFGCRGALIEMLNLRLHMSKNNVVIFVTEKNGGNENDDEIMHIRFGRRFESELIFHLRIDPNEKGIIDCVHLQNGKFKNKTPITNSRTYVSGIPPCVADKNRKIFM